MPGAGTSHHTGRAAQKTGCLVVDQCLFCCQRQSESEADPRGSLQRASCRPHPAGESVLLSSGVLTAAKPLHQAVEVCGGTFQPVCLVLISCGDCPAGLSPPLGSAGQVTRAWRWNPSAREVSLLLQLMREEPLRALGKAQDVLPCCGALWQVKR